ncbi:MAG: hypothetical protein ACTSYQ_02415 [Candidatus Odinarchaeia archaeon]
MPARKLRVEVYDEEGNRYTISFEGRVTRDKAIKILDLVDLLSGFPASTSLPPRNVHTLSKMDKIRMLVEKHFPISWFTTRDVQTMYEKEYNTPISLSTVSTYLTRMANSGVLLNERKGRNKRFKVNTGIIKFKDNLPL